MAHESRKRAQQDDFTAATATITFNASIKALSEAAREQGLSLSTPKKPTKSGKSTEEQNAQRLAEKARSALSWMRTHEKELAKVLQPQQLENGSLALIGKCLAAGLHTLAWREARALKRRLDIIWGRKSQGIDSGVKPSKTIGKTTIDGDAVRDLLDYAELGNHPEWLQIAVSLQLYILRLLSAQRDPSLIEAALPCLNTEAPWFTGNLLAKAGEFPNHKTRCVRQMDSLAQSLLALCPALSSTQDDVAKDRSRSIAPESAFKVQITSFNVKLRWWNLAGHQPDQEKEIWTPLLRIVNALSRRVSKVSDQAYMSLKALYVSIGADSQATAMTTQSSLIHVLSSIAERLGFRDKAMNWLLHAQRLSSGSDSTMAEARQCTVAVRLATLAIDNIDNDLSRYVSEASVSIKACSKGDGQDFDKLLLDVSSLRIAAMRYLTRASRQLEQCVGTSAFNHTLEVASISVGFLLRYLGKKPEDNTSTKVLQRYSEKRDLALRLASGFIDAVVLACHVRAKAGTANISQAEKELNLCESLVQSVSARDTSISSTLYAKVSASYYNLYAARMKADGSSEYDNTRLLQLAVDLLARCEDKERDLGQLHIKYDRLIRIYLNGKQWSKAGAATVAAMALYLRKSQLLNELNELCTQSSQTLLRSDTAAELRPLFGYVSKAYERSGNEDTLQALAQNLCEKPVEIRGLIWEIALASCVESSKFATFAYEQLIEIYTVETHLIKLLRVSVAHSTLCLVESKNATENERFTASNEVSTLCRLDGPLKLYGEHLRISWSAIQALSRSDFQRISECLCRWKSLLQDCSTETALMQRVDNVEICLKILSALSDFLDSRGQTPYLVQALSLQAKVLEVVSSGSPTDRISNQSRLSLALMQIGYFDAANTVLKRFEDFTEVKQASTEARLDALLAKAAYQLGTGELDKCKIVLSEAEELSGSDEISIDGLADARSNPASWLGQRRLAMAWIVYSQYARQIGRFEVALDYSRRAVKLCQRIWVTIENKTSPQETRSSTEEGGKGKNSSSDSAGSRSEIPVTSQTHEVLGGSPFWPFVTVIMSSFMNLARHCRHFGNAAEAISYAEQAKRVAIAASCTASIVSADCFVAECWLDAGRVEKAQLFLDHASEFRAQVADTLETVALQKATAAMWKARGEVADEMESYDAALEGIAAFVNAELNIDAWLPRGQGVTEMMAQMTLNTSGEGRENASSRAVKAGTNKSITAKGGSRNRTRKPAETQTVAMQVSPLVDLRVEILQLKAAWSLRQSEHVDAIALMKEAEGLHGQGGTYHFKHAIAVAQRNFVEAMMQISADFTFSVLPESTISLPASGSTQTATEKVQSTRVVPIKKSKPVNKSKTTASKAVTTKMSGNATKCLASDFVASLLAAQNGLQSSFSQILRAASLSSREQAARLLRTVYMLLSTLHSKCDAIKVHSTLTASCYETSDLANEQLTLRLQATEEMKTSREQVFKWPMNVVEEPLVVPTLDQYQRDYIDIIPEAWTAISLSLDDAQQDLILTRYRAGQSPFIVRLPLSRHKSRDMDLEEEAFDFAAGKTEMLNIIDLANFSAHDAKDMNSKQAKKDWWAAREALDARLADLLVNIENIWLGGFRGIVNPQEPDQQLLATFLHSLQDILGRHLPSRSGRGANKTLDLDPRILELFIGLGDPADERVDLDEALQDLLYFVVDILQFNGERNAYDEVDFDAMVIETTDALKAYHQAAVGSTGQSRHTIFLLDKYLHVFPWESMPCMLGRNVTRLPSLEALRSRIVAGSNPNASLEQGSYLVSNSRGHAIINPSGDLKNTQAALEPCIKSLASPGWTSSSSPPSEAEMTSLLTNQDLLLYFGHGSGGQYIRPRAVKRIQRAPTTWLMGCSSSAIKENGVFNPEGMVLAYLQAGAPAVVGTLWDVTDRDCDRASVEIGVHWGLWETNDRTTELLKGKTRSAGTEKARTELKTPGRNSRSITVLDAKTPAKGRSRKCKEEAHQVKRAIGLDEAVAKGREACYLRYLNGAAFVVYGVPIYLTDT